MAKKGRRLNGFAQRVNQVAVNKSIQQCMAKVKKDFGQKCDDVLMAILSGRFEQVDVSELVIMDDIRQRGMKQVFYSGEKVAVLHAPEFAAKSAGLGIKCIGSMQIDEVGEDHPIKRHPVEVSRTVLGV